MRSFLRKFAPPTLAVVSIAFVAVVLFGLFDIWLQFGTLMPQYITPDYHRIELLDRYNHPAATYYGERDQQLVPLSKMSKHMQNAAIAAEDHDFFKHRGVNVISIARAAMANIAAGKVVQGGSTISQQLLKVLYFEDKKRGVHQKFKEAIMALDMEGRYSKKEILEAYLNNVYFGNGVYGVDRAAEHYFAKKATSLSLAEAAFLAALINEPSQLSRKENRSRAITRQKQILDNMGKLKFATAKEVEQAKKAKLHFQTAVPAANKYRHFANEVFVQLRLLYGDNIWHRGLKVYTTMDPAAQEIAERALANGILKAPRGINQGALVSVSLDDGGVIAMVGGAGSFSKNQWNRALNPHTAGSAFKPFVYLAGLSEGVLAPDTMILDAPLEIPVAGGPTYRPKNFDGDYFGEMTIRMAIALSRNIPAVRVAQRVGMETIVETAQDAGITTKLDPNLSLALGSSAVTPLDMAVSYATIARGGIRIKPYFIRKVSDLNGFVLADTEVKQEKVFETEPCAQLVDAMQDVVERGTGVRARLFDRPVAGKTGTADNARDIWFIGMTPDICTAVWGGNDQNKPVPGSHVTGGTIMAGIFKNYMQAYYQRHPVPAGNFIAPQVPLMEEPEPIHIMPEPAGIFDRLFGHSAGPIVREYVWDAPRPAPNYQRHTAPSVIQDRDNDEHKGKPEKPKKKKKGLIKRLLKWVDDL